MTTDVETLQVAARALRAKLQHYAATDEDAEWLLGRMAPFFDQIEEGKVIPPVKDKYGWYLGSFDAPLVKYMDLIEVGAQYTKALELWGRREGGLKHGPNGRYAREIVVSSDTLLYLPMPAGEHPDGKYKTGYWRTANQMHALRRKAPVKIAKALGLIEPKRAMEENGVDVYAIRPKLGLTPEVVVSQTTNIWRSGRHRRVLIIIPYRSEWSDPFKVDLQEIPKKPHDPLDECWKSIERGLKK